ncbi:hypothetical protein L873DRAFT_1788557 [Choiromyces venosus 120613-1]|uniref:Uncharacterized protein n=1 Tax=Choiromyces venosus 120613-1 TaxID=1336337 RepID=A0A3N4JRK0_9PEZI|nr:hypothetical protein L873DRAFT_1788557 [Choiromyces venosus 120613-1]
MDFLNLMERWNAALEAEPTLGLPVGSILKETLSWCHELDKSTQMTNIATGHHEKYNDIFCKIKDIIPDICLQFYLHQHFCQTGSQINIGVFERHVGAVYSALLSREKVHDDQTGKQFRRWNKQVNDLAMVHRFAHKSVRQIDVYFLCEFKLEVIEKKLEQYMEVLKRFLQNHLKGGNEGLRGETDQQAGPTDEDAPGPEMVHGIPDETLLVAPPTKDFQLYSEPLVPPTRALTPSTEPQLEVHQAHIGMDIGNLDCDGSDLPITSQALENSQNTQAAHVSTNTSAWNNRSMLNSPPALEYPQSSQPFPHSFHPPAGEAEKVSNDFPAYDQLNWGYYNHSQNVVLDGDTATIPWPSVGTWTGSEAPGSDLG